MLVKLRLLLCTREISTFQPFVESNTFTHQNKDHVHCKQFQTKTETILRYLANSDLNLITDDEV